MDADRPQAECEPQIDNERVTVTRWQFGPGAETGWHKHQHDYVIVPVSDGRLRLESADGVTVSELAGGASYFRPAGVEHNVINDLNTMFSFVEIELKG